MRSPITHYTAKSGNFTVQSLKEAIGNAEDSSYRVRQSGKRA